MHTLRLVQRPRIQGDGKRQRVVLAPGAVELLAVLSTAAHEHAFATTTSIGEES